MSPEVVFIPVSLKLPRDVLAQVDAAAAAEFISRSDVIRRFLLAGLKKAAR